MPKQPGVFRPIPADHSYLATKVKPEVLSFRVGDRKVRILHLQGHGYGVVFSDDGLRRAAIETTPEGIVERAAEGLTGPARKRFLRSMRPRFSPGEWPSYPTTTLSLTEKGFSSPAMAGVWRPPELPTPSSSRALARRLQRL